MINLFYHEVTVLLSFKLDNYPDMMNVYYVKNLVL